MVSILEHEARKNGAQAIIIVIILADIV